MNRSQTRTVQEIMGEHRRCGPGFDGCYSHWQTPHCRADGMAWPCDVSRLAEARASAPLDVELTPDNTILVNGHALPAWVAQTIEARASAPLDVERLAEVEHEQWIAWASSIIESELGLSPERVARWRSLFVPYSDLSDEMKEHDRYWARIVAARLTTTDEGA